MTDRDPPFERPRPVAVFVLTTAVTLPVFSALFFSFPVLWDTDSYYHLAVSREYAREGQLHELPWARFSLLREPFGDKELLFHWLLTPFTLGDLDTAGGRWALAGFNALLAGTVATFAVRAVGLWGLMAPALVWLGSLEFFGRVIRLRPELLSLLLLLAATACAGHRRYRLLGAVALVYTLSYTAFHALLVLCLAWFLHQGWLRRRWDAGLLLWPTMGCGLGLLLHPDFPHNLRVWKVQSIDFFLWRDRLDVGTEIAAGATDDLLLLNLPWLLGLSVIVASAHRRGAPREDDPMADRTQVAALCFGVLYLLGRRFSIYAVPFLTLAVLSELSRRGRVVASPTRLGGRHRFPLAGTATLVLLVALLPAGRQIHGMASSRGAELEREEDWRIAGALLPEGAQVAATWGLGQLYLYFAPQARFLNVLDPVFMALPHPRAWAAQERLFDGTAPDSALTVKRELDSEWLMLSRFHAETELLDSLDADPRWQRRYDGYTRLYRLAPEGADAFRRDWRLAPPAASPVIGADVDIDNWPAWPRSDPPELSALEGFVDLRRLGSPPADDPEACVTLVSDLPASPATVPNAAGLAALASWELAAWGRTRLWLDGEPLLALPSAPRAVPGLGVELELPAQGRLVVLTCFDALTGDGGFSLIRRSSP